MFRKPPRNLVQVRFVGANRKKGRRRSRQRFHILKLFGRRSRQDTPGPRSEIERRSRTHRSGRATSLVGWLGPFAAVAVVAALVWAAVIGWQYLPRRTGPRDLLEQAARAEQQGQWAESEALAAQYVERHPDDADGVEALAQAVEKGAVDNAGRERAIALYQRAIELDGERLDLVKHVAEMQLGSNPRVALETAQAVLKQEPNDARALAVRAKALDALYHGPVRGAVTALDVATAYGRLIQYSRDDVAVAVRAASLLRRYAREVAVVERQPIEEIEFRADSVVDDAVRRNARDAMAYLARYRYHRELDPYPRPAIDTKSPGPPTDEDLDPDLRKALELAPNDPQCRVAAAEYLAGLDTGSWILGRLGREPPTAAAPMFTGDREKGPETLPRSDSSAAPSPDLVAGGRPEVLPRAALDVVERHLAAAREVDPYDDRPYLGLAEARAAAGFLVDAIAELRLGLQRRAKSASDGKPVDADRLRIRLVELLLEQGGWSEATEELATLERRPAGPARDRGRDAAITALRARWFLEPNNPRRDPGQAGQTLDQFAKGDQGLPLGARTRMELGRLRAALGKWEAATLEYRRAAAEEPNRLPPRLALAAVLEASGRFEDAAIEYRVTLEQISGLAAVDRDELWCRRARVETLDQLVRPREQRRWDALDATLARYRETLPGSSHCLVARCDGLLAKQGTAGGPLIEAELAAARLEQDEDLSLQEDLFRLALRAGDWRLAEQALARIDGLSGRERLDLESELRLERLARATGSVIGLDAATRAASLEAGSENELAELGHLLRLEPWPNSASALERLEYWEKRIRREQGPASAPARFLAARRFLLEAQADSLAALDVARGLAEGLLHAQPTWALAHAARGLVAEAEGDLPTAALAYRQAMALGFAPPAMVHRLLAVLLLERRDDEARRELSGLLETGASEPDLIAAGLAPLVLKLLGRARDDAGIERWARLAKLADGEDLVLRARLLQGKRDSSSSFDPETLLNQAVERAPANVGNWLALLHQHVRGEGAERTIGALAAVEALLPLLRDQNGEFGDAAEALVVARCFELEDDLDAADRYYHLAADLARAGPLRVEIPRPAFRSLRIPRAARARGGVDVLSLPVSVRDALSVLLLTKIPGEGSLAAARLLKSDPWMRAVAMVARGGPVNREAALSLLAKQEPETLRAGDNLLLARLARMAGHRDVALRHLTAARKGLTQTRSLAEVVDLFIALGAPEEALAAAQTLEQQAPGSLAAALARTRATALAGQSAEAIQIARRFVLESATDASGPTNTTPTDGGSDAWRRAELVAAALDRAGLSEGARALLRDAAAKTSDGGIRWGAVLARDPAGAEEALTSAEQARLPTELRQAGLVGALVLERIVVDDQRSQRAERLISRAFEAGGMDDAELVARVALLRGQQARVDEGKELCRRHLQAHPESAAVWSALARLALDVGADSDQLERIALESLRALGPSTTSFELLAKALALAGRHAEAIAILEGCLYRSAVDPRVYADLAAVYAGAGMATESERAKLAARNAR